MCNITLIAINYRHLFELCKTPLPARSVRRCFKLLNFCNIFLDHYFAVKYLTKRIAISSELARNQTNR